MMYAWLLSIFFIIPILNAQTAATTAAPNNTILITPKPTHGWFDTTADPTISPTTVKPTSEPTNNPTEKPTPQPTSVEPTPTPTFANADTGPLAIPTVEPTISPVMNSTTSPTDELTPQPTEVEPSTSGAPSKSPSVEPTPLPTFVDETPAPTPAPTPAVSTATTITPSRIVSTETTFTPSRVTSKSPTPVPTLDVDVPVTTDCTLLEYTTTRCECGENCKSYSRNYTATATKQCGNAKLYNTGAFGGSDCSTADIKPRDLYVTHSCDVVCKSNEFKFNHNAANRMSAGWTAVVLIVIAMYTVYVE